MDCLQDVFYYLYVKYNRELPNTCYNNIMSLIKFDECYIVNNPNYDITLMRDIQTQKEQVEKSVKKNTMLEKNLENKTKAKVVDNGIMKVKMVTNEMISESKKELRKMKKKLKELEEKQRITHHTIREICKQHDLKFKNQSKTNIMIELHKKINTMKGRKIASRKKVDEIFDKQAGCCNGCKKSFKDIEKSMKDEENDEDSDKKVYQVDHIIPLAKFGTNDIENLQLLCNSCHTQKTFKERENGDYNGLDPFMSTYNNHTFNLFDSKYIRQYAFIEPINTVIPSDLKKTIKRPFSGTIKPYGKYELDEFYKFREIISDVLEVNNQDKIYDIFMNMKSTIKNISDALSELRKIISGGNKGIILHDFEKYFTRLPLYDYKTIKTMLDDNTIDIVDIENEVVYCTRAIDMVKCRKNIMLHNQIDYPIFTVMDQVQQFNGVLNKKGYYYIGKVKNYNLLRCGNKFINYQMTSLALADKLITENDIKYQIIASKSLPAQYFTEFINYIYSNFNEKQAKYYINSLIGYLGKTNTSSEKHLFTTSKVEACRAFMKTFNTSGSINKKEDFVKNYGEFMNIEMPDDQELYEIVETTESRLHENSFSIYNQILFGEACEMYNLNKFIESHGGKPLFYNTDCIIYHEGDTPIDISSEFWDENKTIPKYHFEPEYKILTMEKFPNSRMVKHIIEDEYIHKEVEYTEFNKTEGSDYSDVLKFVKEKKSCLITGAPGVGKSYLIQKFIKDLEDEYVLLSPTHAAMKVYDKDVNKYTFQSFLGKYFFKKQAAIKKLQSLKYIIVDEISMINSVFLSILISIKRQYPDINIILTGDPDQLLAVNDVKEYDYGNSWVWNELVDGNKVTLNTCQRSDDRLYNIYKNMKNVNKDMFKSIKGLRKAPLINIAYTHATRMKVNEQMNRHFFGAYEGGKVKFEDGLLIKKNKKDDHSQDMRLKRNIPLICKVNSKNYDIYNNEILYVVSYDKQNVKLAFEKVVIGKGKKLENLDIKTVEIPIKDISRMFYLAFCMTSHSVQGMTFDEPVCIWDFDKMNNQFPRGLYVSISRNKKLENVYVI